MSHSRKREWTHNGKKKTAWVASYMDAGGVKRQKTFQTMRAADNFLKTVDRELDDGIHTADAESSKVKDVCERFLRAAELKMKDGRIGRSRYESIRIAVDYDIVRFLGGRLFSELRPADVEGLYNDMVARGLAARTARQRVNTFKQVQDYAIKHGATKKDVVTPAKADLRGVPDKVIRTFTTEEVTRVLHAAGGPKPRVLGLTDRGHHLTNCFVNIAAFCGLRYGEISGLGVQHVDLEKRVIRVRQAITQYGEIKPPKTRAGVRDVPIPAHVVPLLQRWATDYFLPNENGLLFSTTERRGPSDRFRQGNFYSKNWRPLLKRAGLASGEGLHFHALRHWCASWYIENGMPVTEVARLLGHATFDMTLQVYAHPMMDVARQHDIVDRMASTLALPEPVMQHIPRRRAAR